MGKEELFRLGGVSAGKNSTASFGPTLFLVETEPCKWVLCGSGPARVLTPFL